MQWCVSREISGQLIAEERVSIQGIESDDLFLFCPGCNPDSGEVAGMVLPCRVLKVIVQTGNPAGESRPIMFTGIQRLNK